MKRKKIGVVLSLVFMLCAGTVVHAEPGCTGWEIESVEPARCTDTNCGPGLILRARKQKVHYIDTGCIYGTNYKTVDEFIKCNC